MVLPRLHGDRVSRHSADRVNERIAERTEESVLHHAQHPEEIEDRLGELDREWDIERMLQANAATLALAGIGLGTFFDRRFLILPAAVCGFLLQHALQGWCPPLPLFRRAGARTQPEIQRERYCLRALRGDFDRLEGDSEADPRQRAMRVLLAITE